MNPPKKKQFAAPLALLVFAMSLFANHGVAHAQREFRVYRGFEFEGEVDELPEDFAAPAEFVIGRLMYPSNRRRRFGGGDWTQGGTTWAVDYPRGDRTLARIVRRLTRVNVRSVEQPVNLDDGDDVYYWPFLMVGLPGYWDLTDSQVAKLRDYLSRGGFLFCDSFFGTEAWEGFEQGMRRIFPDRPIVDLSDDHPVFRTVYDLRDTAKVRIPNMYALYDGRGGYMYDGAVPHWRGVLDDDGRLMVLIAFNNDVADGWQWADDPRYPWESANLSLQIGVNIVVYAMTH